MKRYKVTYRYRKDGSAGIYKTDMMYVSSAEFAIEELKRHYTCNKFVKCWRTS